MSDKIQARSIAFSNSRTLHRPTRGTQCCRASSLKVASRPRSSLPRSAAKCWQQNNVTFAGRERWDLKWKTAKRKKRSRRNHPSNFRLQSRFFAATTRTHPALGRARQSGRPPLRDTRKHFPCRLVAVHRLIEIKTVPLEAVQLPTACRRSVKARARGQTTRSRSGLRNCRQLIATKGRFASTERWCTARANSSLPVQIHPVIKRGLQFARHGFSETARLMASDSR